MKSKYLIYLFHKWWQYDINGVSEYDDIFENATVIYNLKTKQTIKNIYKDNITDAFLLRLWMEEEIPKYIYPGQEEFKDYRTNYYLSLCA